MNRYSSDFDFFTVFITLLVVFGFVAIPVSGYFKTISLQKILNTECSGNYSLMDVALNGDALLQSCKIKNQTITIKK